MKTKTPEVKLQRTVKFGITSYNLLKHGITYCPECGAEVIGDWGRCYRGCKQELTAILETSTGATVPISDIRNYRLNSTALKMVNSRIDWSGIDINEWYEEFGNFRLIADSLGVSERSVKRRYDAIHENEEDRPLNNFY